MCVGSLYVCECMYHIVCVAVRGKLGISDLCH